MRLSTVTKTFSALALSLGMLTVSAQAQAAALNLNLEGAPAPDIASFYNSFSYSAIDDLLTITGAALSFRAEDNTQKNIDTPNYNFNLTANIDDSGTFLGGVFEITGTVAELGYNSGSLLTGSLTAFGFESGSETLEFTFDATGGDSYSRYLEDAYYVGGMVLSNTGFNSGDFTQDWSASEQDSKIDTSVISAVPEPSSYLLMGLGLVMLSGFVRRQNSKQA